MTCHICAFRHCRCFARVASFPGICKFSCGHYAQSIDLAACIKNRVSTKSLVIEVRLLLGYDSTGDTWILEPEPMTSSAGNRAKEGWGASAGRSQPCIYLQTHQFNSLTGGKSWWPLVSRTSLLADAMRGALVAFFPDESLLL